jgi:ribosomal protein L40E
MVSTLGLILLICGGILLFVSPVLLLFPYGAGLPWLLIIPGIIILVKDYKKKSDIILPTQDYSKRSRQKEKSISNQIKYCGSCGITNIPNARFCSKCGHQLA